MYFELTFNGDDNWISAKFRAQPEGDDGVVVMDGIHPDVDEIEVEFKVSKNIPADEFSDASTAIVPQESTFTGKWYVDDRFLSINDGGGVNTTYNLTREETPTIQFKDLTDNLQAHLINDIGYDGNNLISRLETHLINTFADYAGADAEELEYVAAMIEDKLLQAEDWTTAQNILLEFQLCYDNRDEILIDLAEPLEGGTEIKKWKTITKGNRPPRSDYAKANIACTYFHGPGGREVKEVKSGGGDVQLRVREPAENIPYAVVEILLHRARLIRESNMASITMDLDLSLELYDHITLPTEPKHLITEALGDGRIIRIGHDFADGKSPKTELSIITKVLPQASGGDTGGDVT